MQNVSRLQPIHCGALTNKLHSFAGSIPFKLAVYAGISIDSLYNNLCKHSLGPRTQTPIRACSQ